MMELLGDSFFWILFMTGFLAVLWVGGLIADYGPRAAEWITERKRRSPADGDASAGRAGKKNYHLFPIITEKGGNVK